MGAGMRAAAEPTTSEIVGDAWGGLAAMLVALPSAIAFGVTIFLPLGSSQAAAGALAGLIGCTVLAMVAPVFGGCRRLVTSPCAPAAAMLSASAVGFVHQGLAPATILFLLSMISLLAGLLQILLGLVGIGRLIRFIPFPVVCGYLSGVGLVIIGGQIPKFLGVTGAAGLLDALSRPGAWMWQSMAVGGVVVLAMILTPRLTRAVPPPIVALLAGAATYVGLGYAGAVPLEVVGNSLLIGPIGATGESRLSDLFAARWHALLDLRLDTLGQIVVPAATLAVLLSIDTLKTCVMIDALTFSHHRPNRELIAQGTANMLSALVGGLPGAGTMGASLVNISAGARTGRSGAMAGLFSAAAYLLLMPVVAWVPVGALAGILMVVGFRMIDRHSLVFFFTHRTRLDFLVILVVILVAIFGNLIAASGTGVALAVLLFIREQTRSSVVRTRIEGNEIFAKRARSWAMTEIKEHRSSEVVVFELQGSLFFGTASQLQEALEPETQGRKYVVLSMRRVQSLDVTATHVLEQIKDRLEANDAYLIFCDIPKDLPSGLKMKRFLKETGVVRPTEKAMAFKRLAEALEWIDGQHPGSLIAAPSEVAPLQDLAQMPFAADLPPDSLLVLEGALSQRSLKAGKKFFKSDANGSELFIIRRGLVRVSLPTGKGEAYHLATSGPGEIFGGIGFIEAAGHKATATAIRDTDVYVLTRTDFDALIRPHPVLATAVLQAVAVSLADRLIAAVTEIQALRGDEPPLVGQDSPPPAEVEQPAVCNDSKQTGN